MAYMGSDNQSQSIRAPLARAPVSQGIHRTPPLSLPPAPGGTPYLIGGVSLHRSFFTCRPHTRPVPKEQRIIDSPLLDFFGTGKRSWFCKTRANHGENEQRDIGWLFLSEHGQPSQLIFVQLSNFIWNSWPPFSCKPSTYKLARPPVCSLRTALKFRRMGTFLGGFFRGLLRLFPPSAPRKSDSEVVLGLRSSDDALEPDEHSRPMCVRERASVCVCVKCWLSYQSPRHVNKPRHLPPTSPISPFPLERG